MLKEMVSPDRFPVEHPKLGKPSAQYVYTDEIGNPTAVFYRFDNSDNSDKKPRKEFRPYNVITGKWKAPEVRSLYHLDDIANSEGPVVIVEGEKCADALKAIGILATTAFGGCNGVGKTDLSPLRGRAAIIWPDNDEPGGKYAEAIALSLRENQAASVRIVYLSPDSMAETSLKETGRISKVFRNVTKAFSKPNTDTLPKGWDVADAISDGWDIERIRRLISEAVPYAYAESKRLKAMGGPIGTESLKAPIGSDSLKAPIGSDSLKALPLKANDCAMAPSPIATAPVDCLKAQPDPTIAIAKAPSPMDSLKAPDLKAIAKAEEWGEPDMSVLNPRRSPPEFPDQLFGSYWGHWILAKAEGCSAPVDYVGMSLLSLLSALIGCSRFVSPWEGWEEPPMLWTALVGNPSSGKSPALESVLGIVRKIEQEGAESHNEKLRQYEAELMGAQCLRQEWEGRVKIAAKSGACPPIMPEGAQEPNRPERPRIFVSDSTPEALARLLANQVKGLLVIRDELSGWLGSFNRYAGGQGGDRSFYLEAYGGRQYTIDRARNGGEAITIQHLATSILGGIQPDKLHSLLLSGDDDGLTGRFLFCWPDPVPLKRPQGAVESHEAEKALRWLNGLALIPDGQGGLSHRVVKLNEDAADFFQAWRERHAANQPDGPMASWWGKMPGVCLRLALCFEYLWISATTRQETFVVRKEAVEAATVMIEQYLKPMAARAYGDASLPQAERNAATLAKWIVKNRKEWINTREIQREARLPGMRKAEEIREAIEFLVEADWLRHDPKRCGDTKGKRSNDYDVNPRL